MNARLIKLWNDLQGSYYFIPGLMAIGAILLAVLTSAIDKNIDITLAEKLGWFYSNKADGARAILTTIASSMMTVAAVTFSITMVAVTSAAGQYGPRLIGNFMRDRANQITLGTFTSTFVYCLLILRIARTGDTGSGENTIAEFVPNVSLLVAMALTLFSVGVMIFFIHHIPETLNVGNITGQVGRKLRKDLTNMFPDDMGDGEDPEDVIDTSIYSHKNAVKIQADFEGYIQAADETTIIEWARDNDAVIKLQYRPGDFTVIGDVLLHVWSQNGSEITLSDDDIKVLRVAYAVGEERTAHQNALFLADELVEILARALSPGINDPFTAINCINWYQSAINTMMRGKPPSPFRKDAEGVLRVIVWPVTFERLVSVICDQSRPYISTDRNASIKMLVILTELAANAHNMEHRKILISQLNKLKRATDDNITSTQARDDLHLRFEQSIRMINDKDFYNKILASSGWGGGRS